MVVTRSGKNTNVYDSRTQRCGHECCAWQKFKCCACEDTRPMQSTYVAHNKSYLSQVSRVSRNHYYCPVCKMAPPPVKIDFSKVKSKPISLPIIFQKTTEQSVIERLSRMVEMKSAEAVYWYNEYKKAEACNNALHAQIHK